MRIKINNTKTNKKIEGISNIQNNNNFWHEFCKFKMADTLFVPCIPMWN